MKRKAGQAARKGQRSKDLAARTAGAVTGGRRASSVDSQIAKTKVQIKDNQTAANE